jgi:tetratricopeptide (TPR) repeat protein
MSSWLGWILILIGVYLLAVVVRGIIQFISWLSEEFLPEYRPRAHLEERARSPHAAMHAATPPTVGGPVKTTEQRGARRQRIDISPARIALVHWFVAPVEFARRLVFGRRYDFWVASALAAEDPHKKVKYLSKALALNPGYRPAWGLKANALFATHSYAEALECFQKVLATAPNAIAWQKKGLCCYHLGRYEEAVECFDKVLAARSDANSELREEALHGKTLAEQAMDRKRTA